MSKPSDAPLPTRNDFGVFSRVILGEPMLNPFCGGVAVVARGGDVRVAPLNIRPGGFVAFSPARARELADDLRAAADAADMIRKEQAGL